MHTKQFVIQSKAARKGSKRLVCLNLDLLVKMERKNKMYRWRKQGQVPQQKYRDAVTLCRDWVRKAKAQMELDLSRGAMKNKKGF